MPITLEWVERHPMSSMGYSTGIIPKPYQNNLTLKFEREELEHLKNLTMHNSTVCGYMQDQSSACMHDDPIPIRRLLCLNSVLPRDIYLANCLLRIAAILGIDMFVDGTRNVGSLTGSLFEKGLARYDLPRNFQDGWFLGDESGGICGEGK